MFLVSHCWALPNLLLQIVYLIHICKRYERSLEKAKFDEITERMWFIRE